MTSWRFVWQSVAYHWRTNLAVVLGIMAGSAVLTGALIVGDSVRASLRRLTIERLGRIDEVLLAENFLRPELAPSVLSTSKVTRNYETAVAAILVPNVAVERSSDDSVRRRIGGTTLVGCDASFWTLAASGPRPARSPAADEIIINQPLADELQAAVGDLLLIRIGKQGGIAADSLLADKATRTITLARLKVIEILPAAGLGRFSLQANQRLPTNAFVHTATLERALEREGLVNAILFAGRDADQTPTDDAFATLSGALRPTLEDLGLQLKHVAIAYQEAGGTEFVSQYESLTSQTMIFSPAADQALQHAAASSAAQPVFTYVANRLERLGADNQPSEIVPYSMVAAVDSQPGLGPLVDGAGEPILLQDDEIALNQWTAAALGATTGDQIRMTYFDPETTHGETVERQATFTLRHIAPLVPPAEPFRTRRPARFDKRPSLANDPDLTPEVAGITDQESIENWNAPFPLEHRLLSRRDDDYWRDYRTTPKAFVSLAKGRRLWQSRFGQTTSYRYPSRDSEAGPRLAESLADQLRTDMEPFGVRWIRAKRDGLRASAGTTPFDLLFLGFSLYIIAAALMLVSLLFRLGIEQRARPVGLLHALGFTPRQISNQLLREAAILAVAGSLAGSLLGIGYAWLMLTGLRTWWVAAVATPFMQLSVQPLTLAAGTLLGIVCSLFTVRWTLRRLQRISVRRLMSGRAEEEYDSLAQAKPWVWRSVPALVVLALVLSVAAFFLAGEAQAGAFFGSGACVLAALIMATAAGLRRAGSSLRRQNLGLFWLARRNMARNPARSSLTIGLMAAACFLIIAISSFRIAPAEQGTGGFRLIGVSDQPIFTNFDNSPSRAEAFRNHTSELADTTIIPLRLQDGDDASCRNLYQATRPRLIGITDRLIDYFQPAASPTTRSSRSAGFAFAASAASSDAERANPWQLLGAEPRLHPRADDSPTDHQMDQAVLAADPIPVIMDKNTAMYSLHLYGGIGQEFELDYGFESQVVPTAPSPAPAVAATAADGSAPRPGVLRFRVVGLLANSVLQGSLLISEADLLRHFPRASGYRYFLVACPRGEAAQVQTALEELFADQGLDLTDAQRLLTELLAVQNTYISTFQSLGGLGLLLGTLGLVAVQLRNVVQRRGELALMRASGFRKNQLTRLVLWEHSLLLLGGLLMGTVAALTAVLPHIFFGGASVPWGTLSLTLGLIAALGLATGLVAIRYVNRAKLLPALRGE